MAGHRVHLLRTPPLPMRLSTLRFLGIFALSWLFHVSLAASVLGTDVNITSVAASDACSSLQTSLGSGVVQLPGGNDYNSATSNAWNFLNNQQQPACIVFPQSATDVQTTMKAIYQNNIRYAVQAGGHTAMPGWNKLVTKFYTSTCL